MTTREEGEKLKIYEKTFVIQTIRFKDFPKMFKMKIVIN